MTVPTTNLNVLQSNQQVSVIQSNIGSEESKVKEQETLQQKQSELTQDLSRSSSPIATANVSYSFINGKLTPLGKKSEDTKNVADTNGNIHADEEGSELEVENEDMSLPSRESSLSAPRDFKTQDSLKASAYALTAASYGVNRTSLSGKDERSLIGDVNSDIEISNKGEFINKQNEFLLGNERIGINLNRHNATVDEIDGNDSKRHNTMVFGDERTGMNSDKRNEMAFNYEKRGINFNKIRPEERKESQIHRPEMSERKISHHELKKHEQRKEAQNPIKHTKNRDVKNQKSEEKRVKREKEVKQEVKTLNKKITKSVNMSKPSQKNITRTVKSGKSGKTEKTERAKELEKYVDNKNFNVKIKYVDGQYQVERPKTQAFISHDRYIGEMKRNFLQDNAKPTIEQYKIEKEEKKDTKTEDKKQNTDSREGFGSKLASWQTDFRDYINAHEKVYLDNNKEYKQQYQLYITAKKKAEEMNVKLKMYQ